MLTINYTLEWDFFKQAVSLLLNIIYWKKVQIQIPIVYKTIKYIKGD